MDLFNVANKHCEQEHKPTLTTTHTLTGLAKNTSCVRGNTSLFNKVSLITFIRIIAMGNIGLVLMKILTFGLFHSQMSTNNIKEV